VADKAVCITDAAKEKTKNL